MEAEWECGRRNCTFLGDLVEEGGAMSSAAEFVEGGAQDPCDDACSICLESFCEDEPATVSQDDWCLVCGISIA